MIKHGAKGFVFATLSVCSVDDKQYIKSQQSKVPPPFLHSEDDFRNGFGNGDRSSDGESLS